MKKNTMCVVIGLLVSLPLISACHATAGAGKDISKTGDAIERTAKEHTP